MLTLLTGLPGSGKTHALLEAIRLRAEAGKKSILLVPESVSHQFERRLLAHCGNPAGRFATLRTFSKLTEDLLEEAGLSPDTLDAGGRMLCMYRALEESASALTYYKHARRPQLLGRLLDTVQELKACAVDPARLMEAAGETPGKLRDLAVLYTAYCTLCETAGMDPADRVRLAADCVPQSQLLRDAAVFLDDFDGFTGNKYPLLQALLRRSEEMTVSLLLGDDPQLYKEQLRTRDKLQRMARDAGHSVRTESCALPDAARRPFGGLSGDLYRYDAQPGETQGLSLYTAKDPAEECELVAALIRQRMLEDGLRLHRMAVVCGDLTEYSDLLKTAFARYEIPLFLGEKHDVLQTPAILAALGALQALEDGLRPESLFDWLRSGLCGLSRGGLDRLENYALLWNIRGEQWLQPFTKPTCGYDRPEEDEPARLAELEALRLQIAALLLPLREALQQAETGGDYAAALEAHLQRMGFAAGLEAKMDRLTADGREQLANEYGQLYRILTESLRQFAAALGTRPMTRAEFLPLLRLLLSQYSVSSIPASLDSVSALTFERMSPYGLRHLFLVGGREGLLPPGTPSGGLLTEQERLELELRGIELTQSQEGRAFQQQSYLCRALAAPEEALTMVRPRLDAEGGECRPSHVWKRIQSLRPIPEQDASAALARLRLTAHAPAYELACAAAEAPSGAGAAALEFYRKHDKENTFTSLRNYAVSPRGPIRDGAVRDALYGKVLRMTASRLERVSSCRFSYFMEYGLRAKPRKEAKFGAPEVGSFVHDVLEHAIRDLCRNPAQKPEALVANHVNRYLREALQGREDSARFRATFDRIGRNILEILRNVWEEIRCGDFKPACFELDFSREGDLPPLEVQTGSVTLRLGGKIDRVDAFLQDDTLYLKVVDYKTGVKEFHLSDLLYGLNLQMFLYLLMLQRSDPQQVCKVLDLPADASIGSVIPAAALYIPTKAPFVAGDRADTAADLQKKLDKELRRKGILRSDGGIPDALEHAVGGEYRFLPVRLNKNGDFDAKSAVADAAQMGRLLRQTETVLQEIGASLANGDIEATPYRKGFDFTACQWCDYRAACHFDTTMKKDTYRFHPAMDNAEVHARLEAEELQQEGGDNHG